MAEVANVRGVNASKLPVLDDVLWEWLNVVDRYIRLNAWKDVPWWYGERAATSVFAGAIWRAGGIVLEEFSAVKRSGTSDAAQAQERYTGRCDLHFRIGAEKFTAEAKCFWCPAGKQAGDPRSKVHDKLAEASADALRNDPSLGQQLALAFAVAWISENYKADLDSLVDEWVRRVSEVNCDAVAWSLPPEIRTKITYDGSYLPGVALFIRRVGSVPPNSMLV